MSDWQELLNMIKDAKETYGVDMVILDNFMMLKNLITGNDSETEKIGRALSALKKAAIDTDTAIILVAHPTKLLEGQEVTAYSVNGSANFFNISDYMFSLAVTDRENYETTIKVLKVRDSAKGVMGGKCTLKYNPVHFTYSDTDSDTDSSTEDTSTPSQHDTPKGINKEIATDVMKAIMEEEAKQEDSQPAGTTKAATQQTAVQPASKEVKKEKQQEAKEEKQQAAKEEAKQEEKQEEKQAQRITPDFIHNTKVSIMEQHKVLEISSLYNAIKTGRKHKEEIEAVRKIDRQANESEYRQAKDNILSFIPSCVCKGKTGKAKNVEHVNPLIAVDIDAKDNEGVTLETMRTKINSLPYIMYSSLSVGGKGMYALLPIAEENKNDFKAVFNALNEDFKALGLTLDGSCVNVSRERYMSYDDDEYWNTKCEIYTKKINIPTQAHDTHKRVESSAKTTLTEKDKQKVDLMIEDIKANKIQLTKNHTDTLGLGNAIANVWGEEGRGLFHLIRSQREGYDEYKTDKTFDDMLYNNGDNERYGLGLIFTKYKEAKGQIQVN